MQALSPSGDVPPVFGPSHSIAPLVQLKVPLEGVAARPRAASTTAITTPSPNRTRCRRRIRVLSLSTRRRGRMGIRRRQRVGEGKRQAVSVVCRGRACSTRHRRAEQAPPLLISKRDHGIDARRAEGGNEAGDDRNEAERGRRGEKWPWRARGESVQLACDEARRAVRRGNADADSDREKRQRPCGARLRAPSARRSRSCGAARPASGRRTDRLRQAAARGH